MKINGKDIVEFNGGVFVDISTGDSASKEEVDTFLKQKAVLETKLEKSITKARVNSQRWHETYDPKMRDFFPWMADEKGNFDFEGFDAPTLIRTLATELFDGNGYFCSIEDKFKLERLDEIKTAFPSYWRRALSSYKKANHDT